MSKLMERLKNMGRVGRYLSLGAVIVVLLLIVLLVIFSGSGKTTIDVETTLKEVILSSELKTAEYTYNSIAEIKDTKKGATKYYVAYKGSVGAGIDFEDIRIERHKDVLKVIIPEIEILSVNVETEMDYIFTKEKFNTEGTYAEAYNACIVDLEEKARGNETLLATAKQSVEDTIKALIKPFERHLNEGEEIEIVFFNEMEEGAQ